MQFATRIGLLAAALLALVPHTHAATVSVTQISCSYLYFTLGLTAAESQNAQYLGVYQGTTMISEIQFNAAYANTNSYQWYAPFFPGVTLQSGPQQIVFRLLDTNERPITAYNAITQTINFQCGTTVTTSSASPSSPTNGSGNNGSNGSSDPNNSGSSSGSSSSTGAIAGGVAGGVAALIILGLIAFCLMRKKKKQQRAQQSRLRSDEADEAAFRAPNNDSTTSLATAPETANTPMMRDVSTKNVFADPTTSAVSGAPSGTSTLFTANNQPASKPSSTGAGVAAAAAGGIGAAAIAARKQSREQSRAHSPLSESSPTSESFKDTPMSQAPPPVPALPSSAPAPYPKPAPTQSAAVQPAPQTQSPASSPETTTTSATNNTSSAVPVAAGAGAAGVTAAAAAAATATKDNKTKGGKWGFKRASKDMANASKPPYPQAVPEPIAVPAAASSSTPSPSPPTNHSPEMPASPSRSFKVIQKSAAGPSSASIAPSENSLNRTPIFPPPPRSGHATPAGSIRGNNYSRAPSVASMSAGFTDAAPPPLPSGAASVSSAPVGEFGGGNMAGIGAGSRSFAASSGNSTKWHQQSYNIMPNFSHRALARSTQLDEDLIFGHLGMGLNPPAPPQQAGNGSETGSSKSRTDPFGDR